MADVHLLVTYDANDVPHLRQPHTTEEGAHARGRYLGALDFSIVRYEVFTFEVIEDE